MAKQSITVEQYHNPKYNPELPKHANDNAEMTYNVVKTVNTIVEQINAYLTPARVQDLIDSGVEVTINKVK